MRTIKITQVNFKNGKFINENSDNISDETLCQLSSFFKEKMDNFQKFIETDSKKFTFSNISQKWEERNGNITRCSFEYTCNSTDQMKVIFEMVEIK